MLVPLLSVVGFSPPNITPTLVGAKFEDLPNGCRQFDKFFLFVVIFVKLLPRAIAFIRSLGSGGIALGMGAKDSPTPSTMRGIGS